MPVDPLDDHDLLIRLDDKVETLEETLKELKAEFKTLKQDTKEQKDLLSKIVERLNGGWYVMTAIGGIALWASGLLKAIGSYFGAK